MPSYKDIWPDRWLKAEHLGRARPTVAIEGVQVEKLHNPKTNKAEPRLIAEFRDKDKRLILNKTQAQALAAITGTDDYTRWADHKIVLSAGIAPNGKGTIVISPVPDVVPACAVVVQIANVAPDEIVVTSQDLRTARIEQNRAAIAAGVAMGQTATEAVVGPEPGA